MLFDHFQIFSVEQLTSKLDKDGNTVNRRVEEQGGAYSYSNIFVRDCSFGTQFSRYKVLEQEFLNATRTMLQIPKRAETLN